VNEQFRQFLIPSQRRRAGRSLFKFEHCSILTK